VPSGDHLGDLPSDENIMIVRYIRVHNINLIASHIAIRRENHLPTNGEDQV